MNNKFEIISEVIKTRRTVKPAKMNGKIVPDEEVKKLLELADWAPTHKHTEPWRFIVYSGTKAREFVSNQTHYIIINIQSEKFFHFIAMCHTAC